MYYPISITEIYINQHSLHSVIIEAAKKATLFAFRN